MNALGKGILKDVSRSFYLSMRVLPRGMREPISLGYLLARASDTLADTPGLEASLRAEMLDGFRGVLAGGERGAWLAQLRRDVIPRQRHAGEKSLLENMEGVFAWLDSLLRQQGVGEYGARQHAAIMTVMGHILTGQRLDIERFELRQGFRFSDDAELEEYCYMVAGCVGEFWTEVGGISSQKFSTEDAATLRRWGANYGKGLQLINILRDLPGDLENGRCYLPGGEVPCQDVLMEESARWRARARKYLGDGQLYARSLVSRRIRAATALPGLIGARTLDLMDAASWGELERGVKVPRREVYRLAWEAWWWGVC